LTIPVLYFIFRKNNKRITIENEYVEVNSIVPTILLLVNLALLVVSSFIPNKPEITNGVICMVIGVIGFVFYAIKFKKNLIDIAKSTIDFETIFFLLFLFILIFAVEKVGIIKDISDFFAKLGNTNVFLLYTVIVFASVIISAFIDNIPYVATMLPVIAKLCVTLASNGVMVEPNLLYFGLLIGATLGGNITPVGASANVVGMGFLRKEGYEVSSKDFFKIGIPFTLVAVFGGYILMYLVWGI
jgi:Na+/H+ antiporter NhaD/arsenite permease-like protein